MRSLKIWLLAIRPKTLMASVSPVVIGAALALSEGSFHPLVFLFTLLSALGVQICTNLVNDYFDFVKGADTSARKGPTRVMQAGLVSHLVMKRAIVAAFFITAAACSFLIFHGGLVIAGVASLSLLLALAYTAGPYPLAYLGLGDLFVLVFFGPVATSGTYFLQTNQFSWESFFVGLAPGAFSSAILMTNNLRDIEEDRRANKRTLPVRFGRSYGKIQYICTLFAGVFLPLFFLKGHPFAALASLSLFPAFMLCIKMLKAKEAVDFIPLLPKTSQLLFLYSILFCIGWML